MTLLTIIVAVLGFVMVAGLGMVFAGGGDAKAVKRAQAIAGAGRGERAARVKPSANEPGTRRKQLLKSLKEQERQQRKAQLTLGARLQQAGLSLTVTNFYIFSAVFGVVVMVIALFLRVNIVVCLLFGVAAAGGLPRWVVGMLANRRKKAFTELFADAIDVFGGPRKRLVRVAEKASAQAAALREGHAAGLVVKPRRVDAGWELPWELRRDGPRLPIAAWQAVDRAFDSLIATLDDPAADLQARALAFDGLATAARQVADALSEPKFDSANALCTFCGARSADVRKLIAGPSALICDECVVLCVEILEEQIGTDWRGTGGSD